MIKFLASPVIGMDKSNPEFKDLFGHIYRGVAFATVSLLSFFARSLLIRVTENSYKCRHTGYKYGGWTGGSPCTALCERVRKSD